MRMRQSSLWEWNTAVAIVKLLRMESIVSMDSLFVGWDLCGRDVRELDWSISAAMLNTYCYHALVTTANSPIDRQHNRPVVRKSSE